MLELARRAMAQRLQEREVFADPQAVKHFLQLHLASRAHEVFAVLFLDSQNKLLAMEELFRGTLTQLSVTLLRKYFGWFHFAIHRDLIDGWQSGLPKVLAPPFAKY